MSVVFPQMYYSMREYRDGFSLLAKFNHCSVDSFDVHYDTNRYRFQNLGMAGESNYMLLSHHQGTLKEDNIYSMDNTCDK